MNLPSVELNPHAGRTTLPAEIANRIFEAMKGIEGWCTFDKACHLGEIIIQKKPTIAVEVGVYGGKSLLPIAIAMQTVGQGVVYGIDPWSAEESVVGGSGGPDHEQFWKNLDYEKLYKDSNAHVFNNGVTKHCSIFRLSSATACKIFADLSVDLLHIDGNHSALASCSDVDLWLPKVRMGGVVFFDDIDWSSTNMALKMLRRWCSVVTEHEQYAVGIKSSETPQPEA